MLSPTDAQILVGILTKLAEQDNASVLLGHMVLDEAAEKSRDIDITITYPDNTSTIYKAFEVKNENKKLSVIKVEQLCAKFNDMPSIKSRGIVSATGYTKAAIRKADSHGVELYEIIKWIDPRKGFGNILFWSPNTPMRETVGDWIQPPQVSFAFDQSRPEMSEDDLRKLHVHKEDGSILFESLDNYMYNLGQDIRSNWLKENPLPFDRIYELQFVGMTFQIPGKPYLEIEGVKYRITGAAFRGVIENTIIEREFQFKALVRHGDDEPIAVVGLCETSIGSLMGFLFDQRKKQHMLLHIPKEDRLKKVIRNHKL